MKLSKKALSAINTRVIRLQIAIALGVTEQTVIRYISANHGNLTKFPAMYVIKNITGLTEDEILEKEPVKP
jgi:hypothetical protein